MQCDIDIDFKDLKEIGSGAFSHVLEHKNEVLRKKFVIKYSTGRVSQHQWRVSQERAKMAALFANDVSTAPNVSIPKIVRIKTHNGLYHILEERAKGSTLDKKLLKSLSPSERDKVVKGISIFVNDMHQSSFYSENFPADFMFLLVGLRPLIKT